MKVWRLFASCIAFVLISCSDTCEIIWTEGPTDPLTGRAMHCMEILNAPADDDWVMWFCQFKAPFDMTEKVSVSISHVNGSLHNIVPEDGFGGGDLSITYESAPLVNRFRAPEGFVLHRKGRKPVHVKTTYVYQPADAMPSFDYEKVETCPYDMIPRLKKVEKMEGTAIVSPSSCPEAEIVEGQVPGWYRITVDGDISIEASDEDGAYYASVTLENLCRNSKGCPVDNAVIEDWPDFGYRGYMLDVGRNFTTKDNLLKLIDILAHYKVNYLHLHLCEDEGWRLEIDGLPELTSYAAFRGVPDLNEDGSISETSALSMAYCGSLGREDAGSPANGYYTEEDFIEILHYARDRHMTVIPEFDMPGHSRAAIKAMERRAALTGDSSCLLSEPDDLSVYRSAQDYTDNAVNVALPSTYNFVEKVFDAVIALYERAGLPLYAIHIGGDEVPAGAWSEAPSCKALMEKEGMKDLGELKNYFVNRVLDIAEDRGVKVSGWQEVLRHLDPSTAERLKKSMAFANVWIPYEGKDALAYVHANNGLNVIISGNPNTYLDLAYNSNKDERGHSWAGYVDERRAFSLLPFDLYRSVRWDDDRRVADISQAGEGCVQLLPQATQHILGVQGQLWTETIRSFDHVTYYSFPKALGIFERGWNSTPVWQSTVRSDDPLFMDDFNRFFSIVVDHEYPYYESAGIVYHKN